MNKKSTPKHLAAAIGVAMVGSLAGIGLASAAENPFGLTSLDSGYMQLAGEGGEDKCGAEKQKAASGKCGTAKCGAEKKAETSGKCGGEKKAETSGKCGGTKNDSQSPSLR